MNHISVGFSIHRPEIVPVTARIMEQYDVIFLKEPPEDGFENMLNSSLGVEDYLMPLDLEYPLTDEINCIRTARMLSFRDCRILYTVIRHAVTEKARLSVKDYIKTYYHKDVLL